MRGRRISWSAAILSLVIENLLIGGTRLASTTSHAENVIRSLGKAAGDRAPLQDERVPRPLARKSDGLRAQQAGLRARARYWTRRRRPHPDGGVRSVAETASDQDKQREQIVADTRPGLSPAPAASHGPAPGPAAGLRRRRAASAVLLLRCDQRQLGEPAVGRPGLRYPARRDGHRDQLRVLPLHRRPAAAIQGRHLHYPAARPRRGHQLVDWARARGPWSSWPL